MSEIKRDDGAKKATAEKKEKKPGQKQKKEKPFDPLKWEIAVELGLDEIITNEGWGALTTAQSGKLGGIMAKRRKKE